MKKLNNLKFAAKGLSLLGAFCLLILTSFGAVKAENKSSSTQPDAVFERIWIDYNITEGGVKGMRIHVKFQAHGLKDTNCNLVIYLLDNNNKPLKDYNKKYYSTQGTVAIFEKLKPGFDRTVYNDLQMFLPYQELDLLDGNYSLKMDVKLVYDDGRVIKDLTIYPFTYNQSKIPSTTTQSANKPSGKLDRVWVDYDITEKGRKGMRIHVNFTAYNLKGVSSYLAVYFEKKDGKRLKTNETAYASKAGDVALYFALKPGFDSTVYNDAQLFIPYEELNLRRGRHDLKMDVDLIYENGDFIEHLGFHDFWYDTGQ